ncbi:hypothetical protein [Cohnella lupini]|uniref:Uncharacterized protein n=1 Tax=Cohnella lupini TaxID=1294267 RepID=A0A3D9IFA0_9BACL|nr:hypothetical protein [Cohnella lupini]RED60463.1 hypothetical protein DFP95_106255 [Cohnella lupini]
MIYRTISKAIALGTLGLMLFTLTGCLYPDDQTPGGQASAREAVLTVQDSVDRYQKQTDLLPIQNANESVPQYEKYKVDFGKLKRMGYISQVPAAAFESGGSYQFLVIDEETKPLVKLLDLVVYQKVNDVQKKVDDYRTAHGNVNPFAEEIYPGFSAVDFDKLGMDSPEIQSVFSRQFLTLMTDRQGRVFVDYGIDIATALKKAEVQPKPSDDLRRVLIEASYYVPARSPVYRLVNGEPQAVAS